jgi:hypothetical protein
MLLFRDEEHIERWCRQWRIERGAVLSLDLAWRLAQVWFSANRGAAEWRRPAVDEVEALFERLGLTGPFWKLR